MSDQYEKEREAIRRKFEDLKPRDTVRETMPNEAKLAGSIVILAIDEKIEVQARGLTVFQIIKIFALFISKKF